MLQIQLTGNDLALESNLPVVVGTRQSGRVVVNGARGGGGTFCGGAHLEGYEWLRVKSLESINRRLVKEKRGTAMRRQ